MKTYPKLVALSLLAFLTACAAPPAQTEVSAPSPEETPAVAEESPDMTHDELFLATAAKKYDALVADEFETFAQYSYPPVLSRAGGAQQYAEDYRQSMEMQGYTVTAYSVKSFSEVFNHGGELQSLLVVEIDYADLQDPDESGSAEMQVVAISQDDGQSWTFLEVHTPYLDEFRRSHPNISPEMEFSGMRNRDLSNQYEDMVEEAVEE